MTDEYRMKYCKVCNNKKSDPDRGLVCGLTNEKPTFTDICQDYVSNQAEASNFVYDTMSTMIITAGRGKRFANFLIDIAVFYVIFIGIGLGIGALAVIFDFDPDSFLSAISEGLPAYFINYSVYIGYFFMFESLFMQTPGKMVTKTIVVDRMGEKAPTGKVFARALIRLVPFEAFSFFSDSERGWHDKWTDTYVISIFDYQKIQEMKANMKDSRLSNA